MADVPHLYVPSLSSKHIYVPHINATHINVPFKGIMPKEKEKRYAKDLGDILLGDPITGTKQLRNTLEKHGYGDLTYVPLINRIVGFGLMAEDRFLHPLAEGKPLEAAVNTLESVGYSLDILANPVKSLFSSAGGGTKKDFLKSMGWLDEEYREQYQFDTGNGVVDLVAEIISDPTMWMSLGGKALLKNSDDVLTAATRNALSRRASAEVVQQIPDAVILDVGKQLAKSAADDSTEVLETLLKRLGEQKDAYFLELSKLNKGDKFYNEFLKAFNSYDDTINILKRNDNLIKTVRDFRLSKGYRQYNAIRKLGDTLVGIDDLVTMLSLGINPVLGSGAVILKHFAIPTFKHVWNKAVKELDKVDPAKIFNNTAGVVKEQAQKIMAANESAFANTYNRFKTILDVHDVTPKQLQELYLSTYKSIPASKRTSEKVALEFKKKLYAKIPELKNVGKYAPDLDTRMAQKRAVSAEIDALSKELATVTAADVDELVETVAYSAYMIDGIETAVNTKYLAVYEQEMKAFFTAKGIAIKEDLFATPIIKRIKFLVENYMEINGVQYRLTKEDFTQFLMDLQIYKPDEFTKIVGFINYLGITQDNVDYFGMLYYKLENYYKYIDLNIYKERNIIKKKISRLQELIKKDTALLRTIDRRSDFKTYSKIRTRIYDRKTKLTNLFIEQHRIDEVVKQMEEAGMTSYKSAKKTLNKLKNLVRNNRSGFLVDIEQARATIPTARKNYEKKLYLTRNAHTEELIDMARKPDEVPAIIRSLNEKAPEIKKGVEAIRKKIAEISKEYLADELIMGPTKYVSNEIRPDLIIEIPTIEHTDVLSEIDHLYKYATGVDDVDTESIRTLLLDVVAIYFENYDAADILQFKTNLEALQQRISAFSYMIRTDKLHDVSLRKFGFSDRAASYIADLYYAIDDLYTSTELPAMITDFLENNKKIYTLQMSLDYMFRLENNYLQDWMGSDRARERLMLGILDTTSPIYKNMTDVIKILRTNNMNVEADHLARLISNLQAHFLYVGAISEELVDPNILVPGEVLDYINKTTSDYLIKYGGYTLDAYLNLGDEPIKEIMSQMDRDIRNPITQYINELLNDPSNNNVVLKELRENPDYMISDYIQEVYDEVKATLTNRIEVYTKALKAIVEDLDTTMYMTPKLFNEGTITSIDSLCSSYADFVRLIEGEQLPTTLATDFFDLLGHLTGTRLKKYMNAFRIELYDALQSSDYLTVVEEQLLKLSTHAYDESLDKLITDAFRDISRVNERLNMLYFTRDQFEQFLQHTSVFVNAYQFNRALAHSIAVKTVPSMATITKVVPPAKLVARGEEAVNRGYLNLIERYTAINNEFKGKIFRKDLVDFHRKALTRYCKDYNPDWAPIEPIRYFKKATDAEVETWHTLFLSPSFRDKKSRATYNTILKDFNYDPTGAYKYTKPSRYTLDERVDLYEDPAYDYLEREAIITKPGMNAANAWEKVVNRQPISNLHTVLDNMTTDFRNLLKDKDTLQVNQHALTGLINRDVDTLEKSLRPIADSANDTKLVSEVTTEAEQKILDSYGVTSDMPLSHSRVGSFLTRSRADVLEKSLLSWDAKGIRGYIDANCREEGFFIYTESGHAYQHAQGTFHTKFTPAELKEAGIKITQLKDAPHTYVVRRLDNNITNYAHPYVTPNYIFKEQQDVITESFKTSRNYIRWEGKDIPDEIWAGDLLDQDELDIILEHKSIYDALDDGVGHNSYSNWDKESIKSFTESRNLRPNTVIIGDPKGRSDLVKLSFYEFTKQNKTASIGTTNLYKRAFNTIGTSIKFVNNKTKYASLLLNDDFALANDMFKWLDDCTDAELKNFFKRNNFVACVMRQNKKGDARIYKIYISNHKDLKLAREAGAVMLPHEVYRNAVLTMNKDLLDNKLVNMYRRTIAGTYKTVYISTLGFLIRNELDSAIYKNAATSGGVSEIFKNLEYQYRALKYWEWYDRIQADIIAKSGGNTFNKPLVRSHLQTMTAEEQDLYRLIDMFAHSSASGGLSDSLEELMLRHNVGKSGFSPYAWELWWNDKVIHGTWNPMSHINKINSYIEQSSRLGLFMKLVDESGDYGKAIREVVNTHFDYRLKDPGLELLEQVFWFSTFPYNNVMYYINEGLTRNPSMLKAQMDAIELSWNNDEITWDDVRENDYYTYNALAGNMRIEVGDNRLVLKTGSSVMDFFKIMADPKGEAQDRLNPFLSVLFGFEDASQLLPSTAIINRGKQVIQGRSYVPSVYSKLYPDYKYEKRHYIERAPYKYSSWSKRPRIKKSYSNVYFNDYRFMTNKYYWGKTRMRHRWYKYDSHIEPYWYMNNYKLFRSNGRYGRQVAKLRLPKAYKTGYNR